MKHPDARIYHYASHFGNGGAVAALCTYPRPLRRGQRSTWTVSPEAVTCPKCLRELAARNAAKAAGARP